MRPSTEIFVTSQHRSPADNHQSKGSLVFPKHFLTVLLLLSLAQVRGGGGRVADDGGGVDGVARPVRGGHDGRALEVLLVGVGRVERVERARDGRAAGDGGGGGRGRRLEQRRRRALRAAEHGALPEAMKTEDNI